MTESRPLQEAEVGFLRGVHGLIFRDNVRSCGIHKALNVNVLAWSHLGVEPAELSEIAENRGVFRVLPRMLSP